MNNSDFSVFLIDDDPSVLKALARLLQTAGYKTHAFSSPEDFLGAHDPSAPGCAVLDVAMPGLDGLQLQGKLADQGAKRPIIFLTGHGDVPIGVRAMRAGAIDFLLKPVNKTDLLRAVERAALQDEMTRHALTERKAILARFEGLTPREFEVLIHVIAGRLNKQVAVDLGTVEKTIKVHRCRMMAKIGVRTVAELVRLTERIGLKPSDRAIFLGPKVNSTAHPKVALIPANGPL